MSLRNLISSSLLAHFAYGGDTTPPVIESFSYSPTVVSAGSKLSADITVSDASGVAKVLFTTNPPQGIWFPCSNTYMTLASGTSVNGTWTVECDITPDTPNGYYGIQFNSYDTSNNGAYKTITKAFEVTGGATPDYNAPVISDVSYPSQSSAGSMFSAYITVKDEESGVKDGYMVVREVIGSYTACTASNITLDSGNPNNGVWKASCFIESTAPNGDYWLEIHINDNQKNQAGKNVKPAFNVYGGVKADLIPPSVTQFQYADKTVERGQMLEVTARIADAGSGVKNVQFNSYDSYFTYNKMCVGDMYLKSGNSADGIWAFSCEVPADMTITYYTGSIYAYDNQANTGYSTASFQVVSTPPL